MKTRSIWFCLAAVLMVVGCRPSARKALNRGQYDESVLRAVDRLKDNPRNTSAAEVLKEAYPAALSQNLDDIRLFQAKNEPFRDELIAESYIRLNSLYDAIRGCPACMRMVEARSFYEQEQSARQSAASVRYENGLSLLAQGGRENARQAFENFERAERMVPNFRDVAQKLNEAYEEASFKVVVEQVLVTSRMYQLSNEFFQNKVDEFLQTNRRLNKFVRFYTPSEATQGRVVPDHIVRLEFDDFAVGQTIVTSNTETVTSKDSVKVGETKVNGKTIEVFNRVTAKLTTNRKAVLSQGVLDMQIRDPRTNRVVHQEKFGGEFNWFCEWGNFNGDERALSSQQLAMTKSRELMPPPPQQLFIEFSRPIYDRLTQRLRTYYEKF